jgi:hypothetical protein
MSDTTENIGELRRDLEATDLRNITPSTRRNEHVYISQAAELASHNSQETKRNKGGNKKKNKVSVTLEESGTPKGTVNVVNTKETHHRMKDTIPALHQATHPPHHHLNTR